MYSIELVILPVFVVLIAIMAMTGAISVLWQMCAAFWCRCSDEEPLVDPNCFEIEITPFPGTEPYLIQAREDDQDYLIMHLRGLTLQPAWQPTDQLPGLDQNGWISSIPDRLPREETVIHSADVITQSIALGYCSVTQWLLAQIHDLTKMAPAIRQAFRAPNTLWMRMIMTRLRSLKLEQCPELAQILSRERPTCTMITEQRLEQLDLSVGWAIGSMLRVDDFETDNSPFLRILDRSASLNQDLKKRYYSQAINACIQLDRADLVFALVKRGGYQDLLLDHLKPTMVTLLTSEPAQTAIAV